MKNWGLQEELQKKEREAILNQLSMMLKNPPGTHRSAPQLPAAQQPPVQIATPSNLSANALPFVPDFKTKIRDMCKNYRASKSITDQDFNNLNMFFAYLCAENSYFYYSARIQFIEINDAITLYQIMYQYDLLGIFHPQYSANKAQMQAVIDEAYKISPLYEFVTSKLQLIPLSLLMLEFAYYDSKFMALLLLPFAVASVNPPEAIVSEFLSHFAKSDFHDEYLKSITENLCHYKMEHLRFTLTFNPQTYMHLYGMHPKPLKQQAVLQTNDVQPTSFDQNPQASRSYKND